MGCYLKRCQAVQKLLANLASLRSISNAQLPDSRLVRGTIMSFWTAWSVWTGKAVCAPCGRGKA
jgi:hypothetical protein